MKHRVDIAALVILISSAINLGLMGIFDVNVVLLIFGGQTVIANRIMYVIVTISGLWCINLVIVHARIGTVARNKKRSRLIKFIFT